MTHGVIRGNVNIPPQPEGHEVGMTINCASDGLKRDGRDWLKCIQREEIQDTDVSYIDIR